MKWVFIVFLLFLGSLFFREQKLPRRVVDHVSARLSTSNVVVTCETAFFGFRRGLGVAGINVYDLTAKNRLAPVARVSAASLNPLTRELCLVGVKYPRLPESYYEPTCHERNEPIAVKLPVFGETRLVLEYPEILGVKPARVTARVTGAETNMTFDDVHLDWWPNQGRQMVLDGAWRVDLETQKVTGRLRGEATQAQVRPLLEVLDITSALVYMDAFTGVTGPIPVDGDFSVDLARGDFGMKLWLRPNTPVYRGVPFRVAEGTLDVQTAIRGTNCNVRLSVDLPLADEVNGGSLSGRLGLELTNNVPRLSYDVKSSLAFVDALKITEFLSPEDLAMFTCHTPPQLTVKGHSGTSVEDMGHNDVVFEARFKQGAFLGFKLNDAVSKFSLKGDELHFFEATAKGRKGGLVSAPGKLRIPGFDPSQATFEADIRYEKGALEELADFFDFDLGERDGRVDGWCRFTGPATTNFAARLNGKGHLRISEGHLAQMKLFAGLTGLLADKVPGVEFLVNQSEASADFTVTNGIFRSDNVYIEGGLVSLKGWGCYDIPKDDLDFTVRVQFLKKESLMGRIIHPVTFPFTKLLLEFKATGPIDAPKWSYISIIDRIL